MIRISENNRYFLNDNDPYFILADTAWMAFTNLTFLEFKNYVLYRKRQGFNALLIQNIPAFQDMPDNIKILPFKINKDGSYDLSKVNDKYFEQVKKKMEFLKANNMIAFICPVWVSYIQGSQIEKVFNCKGKQFKNFNDFKKFADYSVDFYKEYHPVWVIGGDAEMTGKGTNNFKYYSYLSKSIRKNCPKDMITAHVAGGQKIDNIYIENGYIDFYTFQSGHMYYNPDSLMSPYLLAQDYYNNYEVKPIFNAEPMYEAHGFGNRYGRHGADHVEKAFWYSVLGGANSGFTYGAHGIWMFYDGTGFNNEAWSLIPMKWKNALQLKGSDNVGLYKEIYEKYKMHLLIPQNNLELGPYKEIVAASTADKYEIVVYVPYMNYVILKGDYSIYNCTWLFFEDSLVQETTKGTLMSGKEILEIDEKKASLQKFRVKYSNELKDVKEVTYFNMPQHNCGALLILQKKQIGNISNLSGSQ
jgi:hypothetical protein